MVRVLGAIERGGNKMPNPAILFVWLCVIVIILSALLAWVDIKVTYEVAKPPPIAVEEVVQGGSTQPSGGLPDASVQEGEYEIVTQTAAVQSLLSADGIRFIFTSFVANFRNFAAVAIILVVMIGVGLAEAAGLIGALIRKLVSVSSEAMLTPIIIFIGVLSSVASDAGYLVLIPLGAAAFKSVGRNPLAGHGGRVRRCRRGLRGQLPDHPARRRPHRDHERRDRARRPEPLDRPGGEPVLRDRLDDPPHARHDARLHADRRAEPRNARPVARERRRVARRRQGPEVSPEAEAKGLATRSSRPSAVLVAIALLTVLPDAPLRDPVTGDIIGDSPFMDSLIVIITIIFFAAGLAYGRGAGTITTSDEVLASITKSWAGLASLLFLFLLIAQFIAYFNYSNMAQVAAVKLGDWLEEANIGAVWLLIGFVFVTLLVDFIMPAAIAKWAILAPIFIPLFLRLDVAPQTVLAAYRVGDSPANVITPLMAYFPLIVIFAQRYRKDAGIGTVVVDDAAVRPRPDGRLDAVLHRLVPARDPARARARPSTWTSAIDVASGSARVRRWGRGCERQTITFLVLGRGRRVFIWDRFPVAVVALGVALSLWATGVLDARAGARGLRRPDACSSSRRCSSSARRSTPPGVTAVGRPGAVARRRRQPGAAARPDDAARAPS